MCIRDRVINQLTIKEGNHTRRPDLILFINGLPLVVIELKNATDENATVLGAYNQIKTYQNQIPSLFTYNAFNVISDGLDVYKRQIYYRTSSSHAVVGRLCPGATA